MATEEEVKLEASLATINEAKTGTPPVEGGLAFTQKKVRKDLSRCKILLYGPPKIGKSTLASQFPGPLFLATEEGLDWIECHKISILDWDTSPMTVDDEGNISGSFLNVLRWLDEYRFKKVPGTDDPLCTLVTDNVDIAYQMCFDHACAMAGISDPTDLEWGKGWKLIATEWQRVLTRMTKLPYALVFTSHAKQVERKSKSSKIDIVTPSITNAGAQKIIAIVDIIMYCYTTEEAELDANGNVTGIIKERRVIRCQPQNNVIAGDRTKCLPYEIPMSYEALLEYFPDTPRPFAEAVVKALDENPIPLVDEEVVSDADNVRVQSAGEEALSEEPGDGAGGEGEGLHPEEFPPDPNPEPTGKKKRGKS
jgi:GTPase SAR1 family protein